MRRRAKASPLYRIAHATCRELLHNLLLSWDSPDSEKPWDPNEFFPKDKMYKKEREAT
jgi:hypothetical protein